MPEVFRPPNTPLSLIGKRMPAEVDQGSKSLSVKTPTSLLRQFYVASVMLSHKLLHIVLNISTHELSRFAYYKDNNSSPASSDSLQAL